MEGCDVSGDVCGRGRVGCEIDRVNGCGGCRMEECEGGWVEGTGWGVQKVL